MTDYFAGKTVLVTGASSGLGEEFVRQLAGRVKRLILVARREDRLLLLRADLVAGHLNLEEVTVVAADLGNEADRMALLAKVGGAVDVVVNNAGLGDYGTLDGSDWDKINQMMQVNMVALTHLCHAFLPSMRVRKGGGFINISSLASELPIPDFAVYAATKSYVSSLSEALRIEGREWGIRVLAVCPGPVRTEFGTVARREGKANATPAGSYVTPQTVVRESLAALEKGRALVYPSFRMKLAALAIRSLPRTVIRLVMSFRPRRGK